MPLLVHYQRKQKARSLFGVFGFSKLDLEKNWAQPRVLCFAVGEFQEARQGSVDCRPLEAHRPTEGVR